MQSLETLKGKGQESVNRLVELGKSQPEAVQIWGITGAAALDGALAVAATAKGVLAIIGTVANPPVAITLGALAGGALGWSYTHKAAPMVEAAPVQSV